MTKLTVDQIQKIKQKAIDDEDDLVIDLIECIDALTKCVSEQSKKIQRNRIDKIKLRNQSVKRFHQGQSYMREEIFKKIKDWPEAQKIVKSTFVDYEKYFKEKF